ncbi:MAG: hypothetical protein V4530_08825 [Pseudomonadota bacterium]
MNRSNQLEPNDSRNVTGTADTEDGRWSGDVQKDNQGGEYEPKDSRNVTGTASAPDGRWTNAGDDDASVAESEENARAR